MHGDFNLLLESLLGAAAVGCTSKYMAFQQLRQLLGSLSSLPMGQPRIQMSWQEQPGLLAAHSIG